jgi:hypothetical protein
MIFNFSDEMNYVDQFNDPIYTNFALRFGYKHDADWNMVPEYDVFQLKFYFRYGHGIDQFWYELLTGPVIFDPNDRKPPKHFRNATDEIFWKQYLSFLYKYVVAYAIGDKESVENWMRDGGAWNKFAEIDNTK